MRVPEGYVQVPRINDPGVAKPGAADYPLISFPWEAWTLTSHMALTQATAAAWAEWLNAEGPRRLAVLGDVLDQVGAPVHGLREEPEGLSALGSWVQRWFNLIAKPFLPRDGVEGLEWQRSFFQDEPEVRLGSAWAASTPVDAGYSPLGDALLHSLAVDLALLVTDCAAGLRSGLRWRAASEDDLHDFFLTPNPCGPPFALIRQVRDFLVQAVGRPRGVRGHELRSWRAGALYRGFQQAATGILQPPEYEAFPGSNSYREDARYELVRPSRDAPPAPQQLVAAVSLFRKAGWFENCKLRDGDLASAAQAAWRAYEREDIPLGMTEISRRLLLLDGSRTWSEDIDADIRPSDHLHEQTLYAIERIGGTGFGSFSDAEEIWARTGDIELTFKWRRQRHHMYLPASGRYLSPALITCLNRLLPHGAQRLWFFDHGPPVAVVTRATQAQRDDLEQLAGIRLSANPPDWWTALAPASPLP